ncbi:hypothetical protein BCR33DRAFT_721556 [Rhizoclosmatium globosum]|uniref:C2H2-type domain-containing protein n=1 Tax=Rhizoclosmatium globosum TaxID=329046 RepID=A0A1Y2BR24_9FUNG|nr:hypothetical protein BCR33DRAFT_721556 [Rhizoclosmatium globosum]|eukprot:ORY37196.1 hypothetical protein BCR33DRAFT_721556 [Rhizoclosmatium globosum]
MTPTMPTTYDQDTYQQSQSYYLSPSPPTPPPSKHQKQRHQCPECSQSFTNIYNLRTHNSTVHAGDKPYACTQCPARFGKRFNLKRHEVVHEAEGSNKFVCGECGKGFSQKGHWRGHVVQKHGGVGLDAVNLERNVKKEVVEEVVGRRSTVEAFTWRCETCECTFTSRGGLEFHCVISSCLEN